MSCEISRFQKLGRRLLLILVLLCSTVWAGKKEDASTKYYEFIKQKNFVMTIREVSDEGAWSILHVKAPNSQSSKSSMYLIRALCRIAEKRGEKYVVQTSERQILSDNNTIEYIIYFTSKKDSDKLEYLDVSAFQSLLKDLRTDDHF